jgi:acyl-CoA reductase-like NAD-dependent aldehyde dehydrogenase
MFDCEELPVGEAWVRTAATTTVRFPFDGSEVGRAALGTVREAEAALKAAAAYRRPAAALPSHARARALRDAHARMAGETEDLVRLLVLETGKPITDCRVEVSRALLALDLAAEEARRIHGETVPLDLLPSGEGMIGFWQRRPVGVVVGITGFNYPFLLAMHKAAPAIAAGCPVILKPSPKTPLSALHLARRLREAGVPPAMIQVVTGEVDVGEMLVSDPRVAAVSFTGSAAVGYSIARAAAGKKVILELGSNSALVVAEDADLDAAARACIRGGFYASGQACISVQRIIVVESVLDRFLDRLRPLLRGLRYGDPRVDGVSVGPLIDEASATRVESWIGAAVAEGAQVLEGGTRSGAMILPTLLRDVPERTLAWTEEIFAPVVAVRSVPSFEDALELANDTIYGLHASVFTSSLANAFAAVERLEVGGVVINDVPGFRADNMPYGGVKMSGLGREGPRFAVEELTVSRMVMIRAADVGGSKPSGLRP